jgi:hypothetical protein
VAGGLVSAANNRLQWTLWTLGLLKLNIQLRAIET